MGERLPTGAAAAAARRRAMLAQAEAVAWALLSIGKGEDPAGLLAPIEERLEEVAADPTSVQRWGAVGALAAQARTVAATGQAGDQARDLWDRVLSAASAGCDEVEIMARLERAGGPICREHGPMIGPPPHGWHCKGEPDCRAGYWWVDGSYLA